MATVDTLTTRAEFSPLGLAGLRDLAEYASHDPDSLTAKLLLSCAQHRLELLRSFNQARFDLVAYPDLRDFAKRLDLAEVHHEAS